MAQCGRIYGSRQTQSDGEEERLELREVRPRTSSHMAVTMADAAELRTRSAYLLSREGAARSGTQRGRGGAIGGRRKMEALLR